MEPLPFMTGGLWFLRKALIIPNRKTIINYSLLLLNIVYYSTIFFMYHHSFVHNKSEFHRFRYSTPVFSIVIKVLLFWLFKKFHGFRYITMIFLLANQSSIVFGIEPLFFSIVDLNINSIVKYHSSMVKFHGKIPQF